MSNLRIGSPKPLPPAPAAEVLAQIEQLPVSFHWANEYRVGRAVLDDGTEVGPVVFHRVDQLDDARWTTGDYPGLDASRISSVATSARAMPAELATKAFELEEKTVGLYWFGLDVGEDEPIGWHAPLLVPPGYSAQDVRDVTVAAPTPEPQEPLEPIDCFFSAPTWDEADRTAYDGFFFAARLSPPSNLSEVAEFARFEPYEYRRVAFLAARDAMSPGVSRYGQSQESDLDLLVSYAEREGQSLPPRDHLEGGRKLAEIVTALALSDDLDDLLNEDDRARLEALPGWAETVRSERDRVLGSELSEKATLFKKRNL